MSILFGLKEVYIPKTKDLLEAESAISELILFRKKTYGKSGSKAFYKHPSKLKLEEALKYNTKCKKVNVHIRVDSTGPDAFTAPLSVYKASNIKFQQNLKYKNSTIKGLPIDNFRIDVFISARYFEGQFTPEEILGVILHEIGHNIDSTLACLLYDGIIVVNSMGVSLIQTEIVKMYYILTSKLLDNIVVNNGMRGFIDLMNQITDLTRPFILKGIPLAMCPFTPLLMAMNVLSPMRLLGKLKEYEADKYATERGYGPALGSFLRKLETDEYNSKNNIILKQAPVMKVFFDFDKILFTIFNECISPHDPNIIRINKLKSDLKREMNTADIPKDVQELIMDDIEQLERETILLLDSDDKRNKHKPFTMARRQLQNIIKY